MKLLGVGGSAREVGVSGRLLDACLGVAEKGGWETVKYLVAGRDIAGCRGCLACEKTGRCVLSGDEAWRFYEEVVPGTDAVLMVSPVYFMGVPWSLKRLVDRAQVLYSRRVRGGRYPERGFSALILVSGTAERGSLAGPRRVLRSFLRELGYPCEYEGWLDAYEARPEALPERVAGLSEDFGRFLGRKMGAGG